MIDIKQQSLFNEGMDTEFELERVKKKSKDTELTRLFWNKFNISDLVHCFFPPTSRALKTWFEFSRVNPGEIDFGLS